MITFSEFCADLNVTAEERRALATYLAVHRAQQTLALLAGSRDVTEELRPAIERLTNQAEERASAASMKIGGWHLCDHCRAIVENGMTCRKCGNK